MLLRGIRRAHGVWQMASATYRRAGNHYVPGPTLDIATAWYAIQDEGDAQAAMMNACTASAFAYAALQYEVANGKPDPFPRMAHHACAEGFGVVTFFREAFIEEPPAAGAETRTIVFHDTPSGWATSGVTGTLEPGQFGIPSSAYSQIAASLTAGREDEVSF